MTYASIGGRGGNHAASESSRNLISLKRPLFCDQVLLPPDLFCLGVGGSTMRGGIIGFAIGTACLQQQATLPEAVVLATCAAGIPACLVIGHLLSRLLSARIGATWATVFNKVAAGAAGFFAGFLWAAWLAQRALAPALAPSDEGRDFVVVGTIDNLPYRFAQGVRFNFAVERVEDRSGATLSPPPLPPRIAISWYSGFRGQQDSVVGDVQPGERWRLAVRLQRPHGNANPYVGES